MDIKTAICDNEQIICNDIVQMIHKIKPKAITKIFITGEQLINSNENFAIYLLDIKGVNGLFIADILRRRQNQKSIIIFITGYREYMEAAFDVNAYHYLIKPINPSRFADVFNRAWNEAVNNQQMTRRILIKTKNLQRSVAIGDIMFIESSNKKVILHTSDDVYEIYGTMDSFELELGTNFYRCHRCYLVNLEKIIAYNSENIQLEDGNKILLAHKRYQDFVKTYLRYSKKVETY